MPYDLLLKQISQRLPELEWQLKKVEPAYLKASMPAGLFSSKSYLEEIKSDIQSLSQQQSSTARQFLADRINRKIHILVSICVQATPRKEQEKPQFSLNAINTRHQWLQSMEKKIQQLTEQKNALLQSYRQQKVVALQLKIQQELGILQQQLTLAEEAYASKL